MVDYHINLARELVTSPVKRHRFYKGMLVYLFLCAMALIGAAYLSSINMQMYVQNKRECRQLLDSTSGEMGGGPILSSKLDDIYDDLQIYSTKLMTLKQALGQRRRFLPVLCNLFLDLPDPVDLLDLSASNEKITFGLEMPPPSDELGDPVRELKEIWEKNSELMTTVSSIRPITGERRTHGSNSVFFVQFECFLNR